MSSSTTSPQQLLSPVVSDNSPKALQLSSTTAHPPALEYSSLRSCVTCRRRKVRCNKPSPCSNCVKAGIACVFPPPGRAPRESKRPPDAELLSRLRRLESIIEHFGGNGKNANVISSGCATEGEPSSTSKSTVLPHSTSTTVTTSGQAPQDQQSAWPFEDSDPKKLSTGKFQNEFGRLIIDEGRSRYVSNWLWASLGDEVYSFQKSAKKIH
jgi:hypothetical protein